MKKIVTLALAAVMGLGLVVLPQAEETTAATTTAAPTTEATTAAPTTEATTTVAPTKEASKLEKISFVFVDENGKKVIVVTEELAPTGKHYVSTWAKAIMARTAELKDLVYMGNDVKDDTINFNGVYPTVIMVNVNHKMSVQVKALDLEGRSLFTDVVVTDVPVNTWTTARKLLEGSEVGGYWVLSADKRNDEQVYFSKSYTKGGTDYILAYYETAKAKKPETADSKTETKTEAKPGQVAKTGEVASVATGIGALLTIAGAALATTKRR